MERDHRRALVLNANFLPLGIISWKRAVVLSIVNQDDPYKGVEVVEYYDDEFIQGANNKKYPLPAVVRSAKYIKTKRQSVPFSRKNVFIRDQLICQYCGQQFKSHELTYDHVIPLAKWRRQNHIKSPTNWTNIVTTCIPCNRRKANRTPQEANMNLIHEPGPPDPKGFILGLTPWMNIPDQWKLYLTPIYKNIF